MRKIPYYIVDVFTDKPLGGNPLAVFPDRSLLHENELQRIAQEMNLSETVFVEEPKADGALKRLRIFTPSSELPLAGHPVVGTWYLLANKGLFDFEKAVEEKLAYVVKSENLPEKVIFRHELGAGVFPVTFFREKGEVGGVIMDQDKPKFGDTIRDVDDIAKALGIEKQSITSSFSLPQAVSTGIPILMVPLNTRNTLSDCALDIVTARKICEQHDVVGLYAFTRDATVDTEMAFVSTRGFFPEVGVMEDAATGSAAGCLGAYLAHNGILTGKQTVAFQIEQGADMGRPSRIGVEITFADGNIERVRVGGSAVITAQCEMYLPEL